jgi:(p)ppGpp synthase/HD superfamily hydrolase
VGGVTDEDMLVAAVLHDVVEEGGATLEAVREAFGERAGSLVEELTRREPTADETQGMSGDQIWQLRADMLLEEIRRMSPDAKTVKLADRVSNLMEAARTKRGKKLARYRMQTERILSVIPKDTNPGLWTKLDSIWRDTEGVLRAKKGS